MALVYVTRELVGDAMERLRAAHDVVVWGKPEPVPPAELRAAVTDAEGLLCMLTDRVDQELLDAAPRLRAVANYAVGHDNIDRAACDARGVAIGVTPDVLTDATADLAFALLLAAARHLPEVIAAVTAGQWSTWEPARWLGSDVHGATIGIVGFGRIGQAVARRAEGFDMTVLATRATPLEELLTRSDFVTLHCPLTPATHHLIDARALSLMKPTAILVNTARGAIVDQLALGAALRAGTIGGAALDVTDPEPIPPDDPLHGAPNLVVVPHVGSATRTARARMTELAVDNLLAALAGRPMPNPVA
ncbi:MAG TPA: D-glycerate dehydrogenase [Solirubrobacteraceae bacterium]|nr:D-glycerate dehydrogenase [Solirubrobacteraceae bacterium]